MVSKEPGWVERKLGYLGTFKDNVALVGTALLVFIGGFAALFYFEAAGDWWTAHVTPIWSRWSAGSEGGDAPAASLDWTRFAKFIIGVALVSAAIWVRDAIRELREANARLVHELAQLRVADRLRGLASAYYRSEIRVEDLFGTLKGFSLGMSEDAVYKLLTSHGDFTVDPSNGLSYSVPMEGWRPGNWTAGLVIHGGLLHEVWLMGTECPDGTRSRLEGELSKRFGEPEPKVALAERIPEKYRAAFEQLDASSIAWNVALPSNPVRAKLWGDDAMLMVQARLVGSFS